MQTQAIVLLPGLTCDAATWRHQHAALEAIAPVIIPDLNHADTPEKMAAAALKDAPQTFALAGHSMGGWVALEVMRAHADRVTRLCLLNTTAKEDTPQKADARRQMIQLVESGKTEELIDRLLSAFVYQQSCRTEVRAMIERNIGAFINQERAMLQRDTCVPLLAAIKCPTVIVHTEQDAVFNLDDATTMQNGITNSVLKRIDQSGHMSPLEVPVEVTKIMLDWLQK